MVTFVWTTWLPDSARQPPSASPCTEKSSFLLVSWLPASYSIRFKFLLLNSNSTHDLPGGKAVRSCAGHRSLRRPYRNMICQSIQAVRDAHNNIFQTVPEGISDSSGKEQTSNKCYNMIFFRRSSSTKGLYGQEIKEKYIFDNSNSKRG